LLRRDSQPKGEPLFRDVLEEAEIPALDAAYSRSWQNTVLAARTGGFHVAFIDLEAGDDRELARTIESLRRADGQLELVGLSRVCCRDRRNDFLMQGLLDVVSGPELRPDVLERTMRVVRERGRTRQEHSLIERLRGTGRLPATLLREMRHAVLAMEPSGTIAYANPTALALVAAPKETLVGKPMTTLVDVPHRPRLTRSLQRCLSTQRSTTLHCRILVEGEAARWAELDLVPWKRGEGEQPGVVVLARNLGERQTLRSGAAVEEDELHAALASNLDTVPVGILICNTEGRPRIVNRVAREFLGMNAMLPLERWPSASFIRKPDGTGITEEDLPPLMTLRDGVPRREVELHVGRPGSTPIPLLWSTDAVRDLRGEIVEVTCSLTNISDRHEMFAQLEQSQKMETVGVLAGGVAHDFNNILCAILGYTELLLARVPAEDPNREPLGEIRKAGEKAAGLTRQLLTFSRRSEATPQCFVLNDSITDMESMLSRLMTDAVRLELDLFKDLGTIRADPERMGQILMNLCVNARDAMAEGGSIHVITRNVRLSRRDAERLDGLSSGEHVQLEVRDSGCGMDAATREHIFEPFFTTKPAGRGTGLGLSTVYEIVRQSGGRIEVESELGRGTVFRLTFPRVFDQEERAVPSPSAAADAAEKPTVLVVEDEPMVRSLIEEVLELQGVDVLTASNGEHGLRICQDESIRIDLLVTDVVMPQMTGRDLARRATAIRPDLKVLFVSGYTPDALLRYGVDRDEVDFLQKPFSPMQMTDRVSRLLPGRESQRALGA